MNSMAGPASALRLRPLVAAVWSVLGHLRERHRVDWHIVDEESRARRGEPSLPEDLLMEQFALAFEPARARRSDPETSQVAAGGAREFAARHAAKIWCALKDLGPATIYELAERTGLDHVQVARRLAEMQPEHAVPTGETSPGPSGRPCRVWRAK